MGTKRATDLRRNLGDRGAPSKKTPADVRQALKGGFDPDECNWCQSFLPLDPEPDVVTAWLCSGCVKQMERRS